MSLNLQTIVDYESVLPLIMKPLVGVMPGLDVILRDDLALIYTADYPSPDANQAFLLRATEKTAEALINEVTEYYKTRDMPPAIYVSPACTPSDLPKRLIKRGFVKQEPDESWLMYEHLQTAKVVKWDPKIEVRQIGKSEVGQFAEVMASAYEMPPEWVPMLVTSIEPSVGQPDIYHYLAFINHEPMSTLSLMCQKDYAVIGSAGVVPQHRGSSIIYNLTANVMFGQARQKGVDTILLQTTLGPIFERFLRICGYKLAFRRTGYILA
jgi:hypothetical protein